MLPHVAHDALLNAMPDEYWFTVGSGAYSDAPDASEWKLSPVKRWQYEDLEHPSEPYEMVSLQTTTAGVVESNQPLDRFFGKGEIDATTYPDADAHIAVKEGQYCYDVLNIMVTATGSETRSGLTLSPGERARALCREAVHFFHHRFDNRPLDAFDDNAQSVTDDATYGGELSPPIRADPIPGGGVTNISDIDPSTDAQFNATVELHYVDSVLKYEFSATAAETTVDITQ